MGDGSRRFELIERSEGHMVAAARRFEECQRALEAERVKNWEAQGAVGDRQAPEDAAERAHDDHGTQEQDDEGSLGGDSIQVLQLGVGRGEETH